jgi:hypothetical protein
MIVAIACCLIAYVPKSVDVWAVSTYKCEKTCSTDYQMPVTSALRDFEDPDTAQREHSVNRCNMTVVHQI